MVTVVALYGVAAFFWRGAAGLPADAAAFPRALAVVLAALNTAWLAELWLTGRRAPARAGVSAAGGKVEEASEGEELPRRGWAAVALAAVYALLLLPVGYLVTTVVMMGTLMWLLGQRDWRVLVGVAVGGSLVLHLAFKHLLGVPVPAGFLGL